MRTHNNMLKKLRSSEELPFQEILSKTMLEKHMENIEYRDRVFTPDLTIFAFLAQVISEDQSCQAGLTQVIAHLVSQGNQPPSANTAAYCKARARLPEETLSGLAKECGHLLEEQVPEQWLWRNRPVQLVDGSCVSMPDTAENQAVYPQPNTQKKELDFQLHVLLL